MENKKINKALVFLKLGFLRQDRRLLIYLICVGISTCFWFLNALSKSYSTQIQLPVQYINLPKNKVLANNLPKKFVVQVHSYGFTLLRHKLLGAFSPLQFDVNEFTDYAMETSGKTKYVVLSNQFLYRITEQLGSDLNVSGIKPDTLFFNFDKIVEKRVKVVPSLKIDFKKQFFQSAAAKTQPDSVSVFGVKSVIDTIKSIPTEVLTATDASQTIQAKLDLKKIEGINASNKQVSVTVPIEEFTESKLQVPVSIINKPENLKIKLFPPKVNVTFMIGLSRFSEIRPNDFKLVVSYDQVAQNRQHLKVQQEGLPLFVKSVKVSPAELEYIIEE